MLLSFLFTTLLVFGPVLLILLSNPTLKSNPFRYFPIGSALQLGFMTLYSTLTYAAVSYGWGQILLVDLMAGISSWAILNAIETYSILPGHGPRDFRALAILVGIAFLASIDNAIILGSQGWPSHTWSLFKEHSTYFSFPFQDYLERNVILVNSLIRHDGSPFLFHSTIYLPLTWCHLSALVVFPFANVPRFSLVEGTTLATGLIFYIVILWTMVMVRPSLIRDRRLGILVACLVFAHADILNFVQSLFIHRLPAMEANGTYPPGYFRNTSIKLISLLSPETSIALFMVLLSWFFMRYARPRRKYAIQGLNIVFMIFAFIGSPLLAVIFYPIFMFGKLCVNALKKRPAAYEILPDLASLTLALLVAWPLSGRSLSEWLEPLREGLQFPLTSTMDVENWIQTPFLFIGTTGMLGLAMVLIAVDKYRRGRYSAVWGSLACFILFGGLLSHYVVTGSEIRYGYSLLAATLGCVFVARYLPNSSRWAKAPAVSLALQAGVMITVGLHLFFLYTHTQSSSVLTASTHWQDYLKLNFIIEEKYPRLPILAATDRNQLFPIVMETTTSFASPAEARALSTPSPKQAPYLIRMRSDADVPSYGAILGYRAIEWGPVEDRSWGKRIKNRFVDSTVRLAESGSVILYPLTDNLRSTVAKDYKPDSADFHFHFGERLAVGGWKQEALDNYFDALRIDPNYAKAYNGIGLVLASLGHANEAAQEFNKAIQISPSLEEPYNNLGALLVLNSDYEGAVKILQKGLLISGSTSTLVNLAQAYSGLEKNHLAIKTFNQALLKRPSPLIQMQIRVGLGDVYARTGKLDLASQQYLGAVKLAPENVELHVKLGNALALNGKSNDAISQYNEALRLDPQNISARRGLASIGPNVRG